MSRMKVDVLGVSETHLNMEYNKEPFEEANFVVVSSSRKDNMHRQGVAIRKRDFANGLLNYQISERILIVDLETVTGTLTFFQIYMLQIAVTMIPISHMFYDQL